MLPRLPEKPPSPPPQPAQRASAESQEEAPVPEDVPLNNNEQPGADFAVYFCRSTHASNKKSEKKKPAVHPQKFLGVEDAL